MLAWVHETGAWREAYVAGGGLLLLYGVTWFSDPEGLKSNARMTAAVISERAAPGDLIIVTPETLASSFNYYFRRKNQQIDYPSLEREQVVRYDDRFERMTSEGALRRALARIDSARAQGRRVWFVMEASDMADRFVRPLEPADTARDYLPTAGAQAIEPVAAAPRVALRAAQAHGQAGPRRSRSRAPRRAAFCAVLGGNGLARRTNPLPDHPSRRRR